MNLTVAPSAKPVCCDVPHLTSLALRMTASKVQEVRDLELAVHTAQTVLYLEATVSHLAS